MNTHLLLMCFPGINLLIVGCGLAWRRIKNYYDILLACCVISNIMWFSSAEDLTWMRACETFIFHGKKFWWRPVDKSWFMHHKWLVLNLSAFLSKCLWIMGKGFLMWLCAFLLWDMWWSKHHFKCSPHVLIVILLLEMNDGQWEKNGFLKECRLRSYYCLDFLRCFKSSDLIIL